MTQLLADYPGSHGDEAVDPAGRIRPGYALLGPPLNRLGTAGLTAVAADLAAERRARGVVLGG